MQPPSHWDEASGKLSTSENASRSLELRDWLRQALARLNPRWAEMFVLRFVEDYSNREIAGMMKTSAAVVAVILHRTRALLKKDFNGIHERTTMNRQEKLSEHELERAIAEIRAQMSRPGNSAISLGEGVEQDPAE